MHPRPNQKLEWLVVIGYHMAVAPGLGLLISGSSSLQGGTPEPSDLVMVKIGMAIMTICWLALAVFSVFTAYIARDTLARTRWHFDAASQVIVSTANENSEVLTRS